MASPSRTITIGERPRLARAAVVAPGAAGAGVASETIGFSPLAAMRAEPAIVVLLLAAAGLAWWSTAERMAGMDMGPGTALGSLAWFTGVWAIMMAAMMLPSLAPSAAAFAAIVRREPSRIALFAGGYLFVWSGVGIAAYGLYQLGASIFAGSLAWHGGGRWLAAGVLALAAAYQMTPLKRTFLERCRGALRAGSPPLRSSRPGAFALGLCNGGWCVGCSWALMAALFALGVMGLTWMALIAALVALEKIAPSWRPIRLASAAVLAALAVAILAAPHALPGFVTPGAPASGQMMQAMGG